MKKVSLDVILTLQGPIIAGSSQMGQIMVDMPFDRNAEDQYCLPGSHIKGRLREALTILRGIIGLNEEDIESWFGCESADNGSNVPHRAKLSFEDFICRSRYGDEIRTRIKIDPDRGSVSKGQLLFIESPFPSGEPVEFQGKINFIASDDQVGPIKEAVRQGLKWIPALGGQRSVGFGHVTGVKIKEDPVDLNPDLHSGKARPIFDIKVEPKAPFCLNSDRRGANLYESDTCISGGAIKGCVAGMLNEILGRRPETPLDESIGPPWEALGRHFSRIRFTHAFPSTNEQRPHRIPLSTVWVKPNKVGGPPVYDLALCSGMGLINGRAPKFSIDWKEEERKDVLAELGLPAPPGGITRVHTRMNTATRRVEEEKLFAYDTINPAGHVWLGQVNLSGVEEKERDDVSRQLQALLRLGLNALGKTKAAADVGIMEAAPIVTPKPDRDGRYVVTLQTPALMFNPYPPDGPKLSDALVNPRILFDYYREYWHGISGGSLELRHFFAAQKLMGGYLHYRFRTRRHPYNAFLVTTEGSVFVLEEASGGDRAGERLNTWLNRGLPVPSWAVEEYGGRDRDDLWQSCPFVPENGYGEIAVNLDIHDTYHPRDQYEVFDQWL